MAVYGWIYSNAKMEGAREDYYVRFCDPRLKQYSPRLTRLAEQMLSTGKRYGDLREQFCWFAGFLDSEKRFYVAAVAGKQDLLLEIPLGGGGYRPQFCVLVLGFTEADIRLYQRKTSLFEPLKEILRRIQREGEEGDGGPVQELNVDLKNWEAAEALQEGFPGKRSYNILPSRETTNAALWNQSLFQPVALGILSVEAAKKILDLFPEGTVTVCEDVQLQYTARQTAAAAEAKAPVRKKPESAALISGPEENLKMLCQRNRLEPVAPVSGSEELKKPKYRKKKAALPPGKELRYINVCGMKCRKSLERSFSLPLGWIDETVKEMRRQGTPLHFAEQILYYGYMQLWLYTPAKRRQLKETEIHAWLRTWKTEICKENESEAIRRNLLLADHIRERIVRRREGKGRA